MQRVVTPAQWNAARRMMACEPPTSDLVADLLGVSACGVRKRAALENWTRLDFRFREVRAVWKHAIAAGQAAIVRGRLGIAAPAPEGAAAPARDQQPPPSAPSWAPMGTAPAADDDGAEPIETRFRRVMNALLSEIEAFGLAPGRTGAALDRMRVDTLWTVIRTLERAERFMPRSREAAAFPQAQDGAEDAASRSERVAEMLAKIDARIFELAYALASDMTGEARDGAGSGGGSGEAAAGAPGGARN